MFGGRGGGALIIVHGKLMWTGSILCKSAYFSDPVFVLDIAH